MTSDIWETDVYSSAWDRRESTSSAVLGIETDAGSYCMRLHSADARWFRSKGSCSEEYLVVYSRRDSPSCKASTIVYA